MRYIYRERERERGEKRKKNDVERERERDAKFKNKACTLCTACDLLKHDVCVISAWCRPVSSYCSDSSCAWTRSWFASLTPGYTMRWGFWTEVLLHRWKNHCCQKQGICEQTCVHCCQNREFVNKPHTHLHMCVHAHLQTRTCTWKHVHTHTHTHTSLLLWPPWWSDA